MKNVCKSILFFFVLTLLLNHLPDPLSQIITRSAKASAFEQSEPSTERLPNLRGVVQLAAGRDHACAVLEDEKILCWGRNDQQQIGDGTNLPAFLPKQVQNLEGKSIAVSAGDNHTCAIVVKNNNNAAYCWGDNEFGQLGDSTTNDKSTPVLVSGLSSGVTAISAGENHTCAIVNGAAKCWGKNDSSQLGNESNSNSKIPVSVSGLSSGVTAIAAGTAHTCAVVNGAAQCWGNNARGQLGNDSTTISNKPVLVLGLGSGTRTIVVGANYSCALMSSSVRCWGANNNGQLGIPYTSPEFKQTPQLVSNLDGEIREITSEWEHTCVVFVNGSMKCWGRNDSGQASTEDKSTNLYGPQNSGIADHVIGVATGQLFTCVVIDLPEHLVKCNGDNQFGQMGDDTSTIIRKPTLVTGIEGTITALALGAHHSCALVNGGAWCWGLNSSGQLGDGTRISRNIPVPVSGLQSGVTAITSGRNHTCAIATGALYCWGWNGAGQVGNNSSTDQLKPIQIISAAVTAVGLGDDHTCAAKNNTLYCWGQNNTGQLGDGTFIASRTPVTIANGVIGSIAGGLQHTCVTIDAITKCWGSNLYGQLGDKSLITKTQPSTVSTLQNGTSSLVTHALASCAILNGGAWCWGDNRDGQLGINDSGIRAEPTHVAGMSAGVTAFAAGWSHTCAIQNGSLWCWGANHSYQLANDSTANSSSPLLIQNLPPTSTIVASGWNHTCVVANSQLYCWGQNQFGQAVNNERAQWTLVKVNIPFVAYVVDDKGEPLISGEVWRFNPERSEIVTNTIHSDGFVFGEPIKPGERLIAMKEIRSMPAYKVYITSEDTSNQNLQTSSVTGSSIQSLTVKSTNPLILFNLDISLEWCSFGTDDTNGNISFLAQLHAAMQSANEFLYDTTDGQFAFGRVTVDDCAKNWEQADFRIRATNHMRPFAIPGGIIAGGTTYTYTSSVGKETSFSSGFFTFGRFWNRDGDVTSEASLDQPDGFRSIVHEFAHYGLFLFDQYFTIEESTGTFKAAYCTDPSLRKVDKNSHLTTSFASIMDYPYIASEFDRQGDSNWAEGCKNTEQWAVHGESSWETITHAYTDTEPSPRYSFKLPALGQQPLVGPELKNDFATYIFPEIFTSMLLNGTGNLGLQLSNSDSTRVYARQVQVYLIRTLPDGDRQILDQGTPQNSGYISLVGVSQGDEIVVQSWDGLWSGFYKIPQNQSLQHLNLQMDYSSWQPIITAQPISDNRNQLVGVKVEARIVNDIVQERNIMLTLISEGSQKPVNVRMSYEAGSKLYRAVINFDAGQPVNNAYLWLESDGLKYVTSYGIGGSPDSVKRSYVPRSSSSDGYCEFIFPKGALPQGTPAIVVSAGSVPQVNSNQGILRMMSTPCYLGIPSTSPQISKSVALRIFYNQQAVANRNSESLLIYRLNEATNLWEAVSNGNEVYHDVDNRFVSVPITKAGLYIVAAEDAKSLRLNPTDKMSGEEILNVVSSPLAQTLPFSEAMGLCFDVIEKAYTIDPSDPTAPDKVFDKRISPPQLNSLTEFKPGLDYYLKVNASCVLNFQPAIQSAAAITTSDAISVPIQNVAPAIIFGEIDMHGTPITNTLDFKAIDKDKKERGEGFAKKIDNRIFYVLSLPTDDDRTTSLDERYDVTLYLNGVVVGTISKEQLQPGSTEYQRRDWSTYTIYLPAVSR